MKTLLGLFAVNCVAIGTMTAKAELIKRTGNIVEVSCSATSLSQGFARKAAIDDCKKSVAGLLDSTVKVNSKVWTTKNDVYYHEETDSLATYEGLHCEPSNEHTEELNKQVKVSLKCKFDVSTAKALPDQLIKTGEKIDLTKNVKQEIESETYSIQIASFPVCDKISVVGSDETKCDAKLTSIVLKSDAKEVIVEKQGFLPYRIELNGKSQSLVVILLPL